MSGATFLKSKCCCPEGCEWCDTNTTPHNILITLSGITECGCAHVDGTFEYLVDLPATVTLVQNSADPCHWFADVATATLNIYNDAGCAGGIQETFTGTIHWDVVKGDNTWTLGAEVGWSLNYSGAIFSSDTLAGTDCEAGLTFTNQLVLDQCGHDSGGHLVTAYDGTATKDAA